MRDWDLRTEEGRNGARKEHKEEIEKLQALYDTEQAKIDALVSQNSENIGKRDEIKKKIASKKSTGKFFIVLGVIAAVIGCFSEIIISIIGVPVIAFGIFIFMGWKKFKEDIDKYNELLKDFDSVCADIDKEKMKYQEKIDNHERALYDIELKERYAKVDTWIESVSTGCIGLYVTTEMHTLENTPRKPEAKKYDGIATSIFRNGAVYVNDMVYGNLKYSSRRARCFDVFRIENDATQKMEILLDYQFGTAGEPAQWLSQPTPVKLSQSSKFVWCHISLCGKGTQVFASTYDTMKDFLDETGITKDELMEMFV